MIGIQERLFNNKMSNQYTLFVLKDNKEIARTVFSSIREYDEPRSIVSANYDEIILPNIHHVEISGLENMKCKLNGNKTDLVIVHNNEVKHYECCFVKHKYKDGYDITYKKRYN